MSPRTGPKHAPAATRRRSDREARPARFHVDGAARPSPELERWLTRGALALIGLVAVALLILVSGPHKVGDYFTETDFYGAYARGARLVQQGVLDPSRYAVIGPLYEVVLGLVGFVVRDLFLAAELIAVVCTALTMWLWFVLLRARADARVALAALAVMACNATFFRYGYAATTDALAMALMAGAMLLLAAGRTRRAALLAGLVAGLAFLTRYTAVALLPAGLMAALLGATLHDGRRGAAWRFALGFAAPVLPWVLYSLSHGGGFSFQLHHNIAYDVFARARGITWDEYQRTLQPQFPTLWSVIARDPMAVVERLAFNVGDHLRLDAQKLLGIPMTIVVLCGLALGFATRALRPLLVVWLAAAWLFLALLPAFYAERYAMALLPAYAALAGIAIGSPRLALAFGRPRAVWLKPVLALLPIGLALAMSWRAQARTLDQLPTEVLEAAATLRGLKQPGDRVIARKAHVAYHAGVEPLPFPFADSLGALAADAHRQRARWLYFSWPEAETRPALFFLLDTTGVVPGLTPRKVTSPHPAVLYEIGPTFGVVPGWMRNDTLVAIHTLRARMLVDSRDDEALYNLALLERLQGMPAEAYRHATEAARRRPRAAQRQMLVGVLAQERGDYAASIGAFQRVLAIDRTSARASIGLGWSLALQGDARAAAAVWRPWVDAADDAATLEHMVSVFDAVGDAASAARARTRLAGTPR